jgi:hypothetical protein
MSTRTLCAALLALTTLVACSSPGPTSPTGSTTEPPTTTPVPAPAPAPVPVPPAGPQPVAPETATYRVTFDATWSAITHPVDIPGSAHFSRLVGANHSNRVTFWREGQLASQGIREMAEFGRTNPLDAEIRAAIASGAAEALFIGPAVDKSPATVTMEVTVSQRHPMFTLVSMIAPSPDWFVGVTALPLFEAGQWVSERRVALDPWDAGTDSGVTFFSPDAVSNPFMPVARIVTAPLSPNGVVTPLGTFIFTRIN